MCYVGRSPPDNIGTTTKYKYIGRPKTMPLPSDSWKRGELVRPLKVPKPLITDAVYLGDFRMATKDGTDVRDRESSPMDIRYYAPGRFHNENPSFASDTWSYIHVPFFRNSGTEGSPVLALVQGH